MKIQDNANHDSQRSTKKNRNNKASKNSSANPSLPVELILEILQFLPVLSLLKFRSVCKLWLSMISSPKFVKHHLSKSSESSHFANGRLLSSSFYLPDEKLRDCSVYSLLNEPFCKPVVVDSPITTDPYMLYSIVGSCNGLICVVSGDNKLFLWNPATRKLKQLQNSDIENYKCSVIVYGFGYDDLDDDYKVVAIFCFYLKESRTYKMKVKICSSRLDRWRSIEDFPSTILLNTTPCQSGKLANGVLHWAATRNVRAATRDLRFESLDSWIIVSLDLKTEEYGEVVQPKYGEGIYNLTLGVLGRSLCVLGDYQSIRADVWIMKEYGVKKSWTKLASIPYVSPYVSKPRSYEYSLPLCISTNGDIVLEGGDGIVVYNSKDCRFKDIVITKSFVCFNAIIYIGSLVSPNV